MQQSYHITKFHAVASLFVTVTAVTVLVADRTKQKKLFNRRCKIQTIIKSLNNL